MFRIRGSLVRACIFALLFSSSANVFAAVVRSTTDTNTQRDLTSDEIDLVKQMLFNQSLKPYSVNVYGLLQGNFNFVDTTRNNTPDFSVSHARLGLLAIESNWSGKLEVEFVGNQPRALFPKSTPLYLTQSGNNTVTVRQAQINFDFYNHTSAPGPVVVQQPAGGAPTPATAITDDPQAVSNVYISRLSIGGIRVGGAAATAPDPANTPSGFSRQDGIYLVENMVFGKQTTANLGFGIFNTLSTTNAGSFGNYQGWSAYPGTSPNFLGIIGVTSSTFSKAYIFNAGYNRNLSSTSYVNVVGYYGFQNDAAVNTNENGFATTTRNATHIEASASYNDSKIFGDQALLTGNGIVLYAEVENGSDQQKTGAAPAIDFNPTLNDGYTHTLYGLSLGGDTSKYYSSIFKNADRFLYAGSITYVDAKFDHHSYSRNYTVTQFAGSVGYGYKTLEFALNAAYSTSPQAAFTKFNVNATTNNTRSMNNQFTAYITAALYF